MRDLSDQVEDVVAALDARLDGRRVAHVVHDQVDAVAHVLDVEEVAAVARHERVDHGDVGAELDQASRDVRADEAESAGHERAATGEGGPEVAIHARPIRFSRISSRHSLPSPIATCPTRFRLKNCERPWRRW